MAQLGVYSTIEFLGRAGMSDGGITAYVEAWRLDMGSRVSHITNFCPLFGRRASLVWKAKSCIHMVVAYA
jgi:hypothetical protein